MRKTRKLRKKDGDVPSFIRVIVLFVALTLAVVYSNVYDNITENSNFTTIDAEFGIIGIILDLLPIIILIFFVGIGFINFNDIFLVIGGLTLVGIVTIPTLWFEWLLSGIITIFILLGIKVKIESKMGNEVKT